METTLVIMAAGIGSRFGTGIKQLAKVDECEHIVIDYSIHDAIEAGFNSIIFIIRKEIEAEFKEVIGNRIETLCGTLGVKVGYAYQNLSDIPAAMPEGRTKPWGTGHAVLAARDLLTGPFAVINADDYYGKSAYFAMHEWLCAEHAPNTYAMAGFVLKNTLSDNGGVTRGICSVDSDGRNVLSVCETKNIVKTESGAEANGKALNPESFVSMNFWGFAGNPPKFVEVLKTGFEHFFDKRVPADPMKAEYLLPDLIGGQLDAGGCSVELLRTDDSWYGMTYKDDVPVVQARFAEMLDAGKYAKELYSDLL